MNTKYLGAFILILISGFIFSCEDDLKEINDFKGYYKIASITSSTPIDLNNDGLKSEHYLDEIKSDHIIYNGDVVNYGYDNESKYYFAEARPTRHNTANDVQFLDIRFPIQSIHTSSQSGIDSVYNKSYEIMSTGFIYELTNDNIEIESDPFEQFEFWNIKNFEINRINKVEFEVLFDFKVYDFLEDTWIETNLHGKYEKVSK